MAKNNKKKKQSKLAVFAKKVSGIFLIMFVVAVYLSLLTYNPADPSLNQQNNLEPTNILGLFGSNLADFILCSFGIAIAVFMLGFVRWGIGLIRHNTIVEFKVRLFAFLMGVFSLSSLIHLMYPKIWGNYHLGGKVAQISVGLIQTQLSKYNIPYGVEIMTAVFALISFMSFNMVLGITLKCWYAVIKFIFNKFFS